MIPGEKFETSCYEFLKEKYKNVEFYHEGKMDSTKSDIAVIKNNNIKFYIEAKDTKAQSGQFVLIPDKENETFIFSPRNKSKPNEMTDIIITYMNQSFEKFNSAGTSGQSIDIDSSVFAKWITNYYQSKNVKYVISFGKDYVILPIRKFSEYFEITAKFRIKKSGSSNPAKKDLENIVQTVKTIYPSAYLELNDKKLIADISSPLRSKRFNLNGNTYFFSEQSPNVYRINKLSKTYHMNVIFSIKLIKEQSLNDLKEFESNI